MSCEQMVKYQTNIRPQVMSRATNSSSNSTGATTDPYVFTEPPSIQKLQLHKTTAKGNSRASVYSLSGTSAMKVPRHNVNESLKKKLGIQNIRSSPASSIQTTVAATPQPPPAPLSMAAGRSKRRPVPRQLDIIESEFVKSRGRPANTNSRQKGGKRDAKKVPVTSTNTPQHPAKDSSVTQEPLWFVQSQFPDEETEGILHMKNWFIPEICDSVAPRPPSPGVSAKRQPPPPCPPPKKLTREELLELKRNELRRRTLQLRNAQRHRDTSSARRRFLKVLRDVQEAEEGQGDKEKETNSAWFAGNFCEELKLCRTESCQNEALLFSTSCPVHVGGRAEGENLFATCSARLPDQSLCSRVLIAETDEEPPLCGKHTALRTTRGTTTTTQTVKKAATTTIPQKKANNNNNKRSTVPGNAKRRVENQSVYLSRGDKQEPPVVPPVVLHHVPVQKQQQQQIQQIKQQQLKRESLKPLPQFTKVLQAPRMVVEEQYDFVDEDDSVGLDEDVVEEEHSLLKPRAKKSSQCAVKRKGYNRANSAITSVTGPIAANQTDLLLVSENSSAYESSEDTGVGGLSESEMIEEIGFDSQFLEDPEFNNVLEDLLAVEQHGEMFEMDDDVKTMEMTGTSTFLGDFLADQMLRDPVTTTSVASTVAVQRRGGGGDSAMSTTKATLIQT